MNRKKALKMIAVSAALPVLPKTQTVTGDFLMEFIKRWEIALSYSLKVLNAMPAELYDFKPSPELMSFGKQFTHAAHWNTFFIGTIVHQPPIPEPTTLDKPTVIAYYTQCHDYCTDILKTLSEQQLIQTGYGEHDYWKKHTGTDYLLRAFMHIAHHRAETLLYLRLNGIEPPFFEF